MKIHINVTQEHIENGQKRHCAKCPVALAIKDICKPNTYVSVSSFIGIGRTFSTETPNDADRFIARFDSAYSVEPFSFELDIPDELLAEAK